VSPFVCGEVITTLKLPRPAGVTETPSRPAGDVLMVPSVTDTKADSTRYRRMTPLLPPLVEATPAVKVICVLGVTEKLRAVPSLSLTVGLSPPGETLAPEKLNVLMPAYPVAVFPEVSCAVMVRGFEAPAIAELDPERTNRFAIPGDTVTVPDVPVFPVDDVALNWPFPEVPVYVRFP
jgi:hypothetical protein